MDSKEKYFLYILLASSLVLTFFIFLPFLVPLIFGVSFAVLLHPWFRRMLRVLGGRRSLSAFITILSFIIIICIPIAGIGFVGYQETQSMLLGDSALLAPSASQVLQGLQEKLPQWLDINVQEQVTNLIQVISRNTGSIFSATFGTLMSLFLMVLSMFFFLRDGKQWRESVIKINPLSDSRNNIIIDSLERSIKGIVQGYLLIAVIQGTLTGVGLWIFGVPHVVLWGAAAAIASLVPIIGTLAVTVPIVIYLFLIGDTLSAVGFLGWAVLLVGGVDNILNPIVVGCRVNIHPLMILLSVLGGVSFFGPAGILLGPLSASLLYTLITMYRKEFS
jgi:predicted PurR-regulated permease PerM